MDAQQIKELVQKSKTFGTEKLPTSSHSEAAQAIIAICEASPQKSFSAKDMQTIIGDETKTRKFYTDKMWQLAEQGILEHATTKSGVVVRGLYRYHKKEEKATS